MNGTVRTTVLFAVVVMAAGCIPEGGPGHKIWVAGAQQEDLIGQAIATEAWLGMTKDQLERVLQAEVFPNHTVSFSYRRPDTDLFGARFDEALVIHRPLKFDDVWILFRDAHVAHVAAVFIE